MKSKSNPKKKVMASQNKAKMIEKQSPSPQSSEELAFLLNQNYQQVMQAQANIQVINRELERRQLVNKKVKAQKEEQKDG